MSQNVDQNVDFPIWTHSGRSGPLQYQITIQPKSAIPGSFWVVQTKVDAPPGWTLKKGGLTNGPTASGRSEEPFPAPQPGTPWTFQVEYQGDLPPFGPGPQLETLWETPQGAVSILLDPGLELTTMRPLPGSAPGSVSGHGIFPWALSFVLILFVLFASAMVWIRSRPKNRMRRWTRKTWGLRPPREATWSIWEEWLNNAAHSARKRLPDVAEARVLISLLDESRFGPPFNDAWTRIFENMNQ